MGALPSVPAAHHACATRVSDNDEGLYLVPLTH